MKNICSGVSGLSTAVSSLETQGRRGELVMLVSRVREGEGGQILDFTCIFVCVLVFVFVFEYVLCLCL